MGEARPDVATLRKGFEGALIRVRKRMGRCVQDPTPENIHDVRTSIRRLQAAHMLLPRNSRKERAISGYLASVRELLKATNPVRDADIIRAKTMHILRCEDIPAWMQALDREREQGLIEVFRIGKKLGRQPVPRLPRSEPRERVVRKRIEKIIGKLSRQAQEDLRLLGRKGEPVDAMHRLRMHSRRLRYVLEATRAGKPPSQVLSALKRLQDQLGGIHDCDVTVLYLARYRGSKGTGPLADKVRSERARLWGKFSRTRGKPAGPLPKLRALR